MLLIAQTEIYSQPPPTLCRAVTAFLCFRRCRCRCRCRCRRHHSSPPSPRLVPRRCRRVPPLPPFSDAGTTEMKSRPKRNRKRPRGGIGCLVGDGESDDNSDEISPSSSSVLRTEVVPLLRAFDVIIAGTSRDQERREIANTSRNIVEHERRVRIVYPYPFKFATFAKARWVGRTVADIYHEEFGEKRSVFRVT